MPSGSSAPSSEGSASGVVARNFLALGSGEALARIVAFGATVYIARTLGPASYGVIGVAAAVMLYLGRVADFGIEQGLGLREIAAHHRSATPLITSLVTVRMAWSLVLSLAVAVGSLVFAPEPEASVLAVMAIVLAVQGGNVRWVHLGFERTGMVAVARTVGELVMVGAIVLLVHDPGDLARVPLAQVVGDSVLVLLLAVSLRRAGLPLRLHIDRSRIAPLLPRAVPLMLSALLGLIIFNSDLIFLRIFRSAGEAGYYAAAYGLISFMINLGGAYSQSLLPTLTRLGARGDDQHRMYTEATAQVFAVTLPATLGVALLAPIIVRTIFGPAYAPAAGALVWLSGSVFLLLVRGVPNVALLARGREDRVFQINLVATVVNLTLNVILIPRYGILGAAWSTFATEAIRFVTAQGFARWEGFPLPLMRRMWRSALAGAALIAAVQLTPTDTLWWPIGSGAMAYLGILSLAGGIRWQGIRPRLTV